MPNVTIEIFPRPLEVRRQLVERMTDAISETLEIDPERIRILVVETERDHVSRGGKLASER